MKKMFLAAALVTALTANAQVWKLDNAHTKIMFSTDYLVISDVDGEFREFDGTFTSSKDDWTDLKAEVTVKVNSIDTDNEMRDNHLKGEDFFDAAKFPTMTFRSNGIRKIDKNKYVMTGELTIRGVTKTVEVPVVFNGTVKDPWGNYKAGFKATGKINRKDFGLKYNNAAATGEAVVGDEVEFTINAVLIKG